MKSGSQDLGDSVRAVSTQSSLSPPSQMPLLPASSLPAPGSIAGNEAGPAAIPSALAQEGAKQMPSAPASTHEPSETMGLAAPTSNSTAATPIRKPPSNLNPNAKAFSLNPAAKEFMPGNAASRPASAASIGAGSAGTGQTAGNRPSSSRPGLGSAGTSPASNDRAQWQPGGPTMYTPQPVHGPHILHGSHGA